MAEEERLVGGPHCLSRAQDPAEVLELGEREADVDEREERRQSLRLDRLQWALGEVAPDEGGREAGPGDLCGTLSQGQPGDGVALDRRREVERCARPVGQAEG